MLENIKNWLTKLPSAFAALSMGKKALIGVTATLLLSTGIGVWLWASQDPYQVLYTDLQAEEGRAIVRKLGEQGIPHTHSVEFTTVSVPQSKVASARMQLAKEGLPGQDVVGFEKFDGSTLGMSSYVQRIHYVRAVQGELTRSIQRIAAVKSARVHISMPPKRVFLEEQEEPKASVVLDIKAGQTLSKQETGGIAHLVASAVEGLKVAQVTIVDTHGNFLHRPEEAGDKGFSSAFIDMQRGIESEYQKRIEEILVPVVGYGKIRAKVTVELDPSRSNTTEETYDPDNTAVRNTVKNEESFQGTRPNPIGIPGSRSNLPGAEAQNPGIPMANSNTEKSTQNTSYSVPKKVQVTDRPSGGIKRVTAAVVVDGHYEKSTGKETFSPRTEEEITRLKELVANAIGFDSQRRDSINITSLQFRSTELEPEILPEVLPVWRQVAERLGPVGLGLLGAGFLSLFGLGFWMLRRSRSEPEADLVGEFPRTVAEMEAISSGNPMPATLAKSQVLPEDSEPAEKQEEMELRTRILDRLGKSPRKGLHIIQDWLDDETPLSLTPQNT